MKRIKEDLGKCVINKDVVAFIDLEIDNFMEGGGSGSSNRGSSFSHQEEMFHLWVKSFDRMFFTCDHLHATSNVE